ncbi:glycerate kinase type-2 family protein [Fervidobacterium thailandense]|uniref:glycerate 2-kinase n=1 Tax=Fervidobacterium thailandense TaxID=1008305 RepID=A0A1E3G4H0_9BACT|nr:glycerate kinase [Fervidobacterium thailandense]ODN31020.1 glycerate kinase [Fervidobacterium thailandense]
MRADLKTILRAIVDEIIKESDPYTCVREYVEKIPVLKNGDQIILVAIGKAAWRMAKAAKDSLKERIKTGIVVTKYGHSEGDIEGLQIYEAGHPIPDENSLIATKRILEVTSNLSEKDLVLFLVSGGGSSLFELPQDGICIEDIQKLTTQLLKSGASIVEINTVRKRLSKVKGGRFAQHVYPARIVSLVLSDVLGDRLDTIASGPAYPDSTTTEQVLEIIKRYNLKISKELMNLLLQETPKELPNVETYIVGNVQKACKVARDFLERLGLNVIVLTTQLSCEAREAGRFLAAIAKEIRNHDRPVKKPAAVIVGGETVVRVTSSGKGGRNQELALAFAVEVDGMDNLALCSFGTDGTDGPTDAAGGIVDGNTCEKIRKAGYSPQRLLDDNDSYTALKLADDLLVTGPTGTNVNDVVILIVE